MKNITISVPDDLWARLKRGAEKEKRSLNSHVRAVLSEHEGCGEAWTADFLKATEDWVAPRSWKWNRDELYEEAI